MDGGGSIAAADDGADSDDDDIDEEMFAIARVPRIVKRFEVGGDKSHINKLGHGKGSRDRSVPDSARRTKACGHPNTATDSKISSRRPSRQTTQAAQLCARAVRDMEPALEQLDF